MQRALSLLRERSVDFEVDGEMHAGAALDPVQRKRAYNHSTLTGPANLLVMPNADAAHIALNLLREMGEGVAVGPILIGAAKPVHIASQSVTVRGLLNLTALAAVDTVQANA
jgi:malate dehydrogenase (oxaloacetate-decarboxylating)(NADP+)